MKRILDIIIASVGIIIFSPLMVLIAISIFLCLGRPVIFSQIRPGKDCKPFKIFKFRTMTNEIDERGQLLSNERRTTKLGNFLRQSSLDELPEFYVVLKGDMSIVGPRPLLMDYVPLFNEFQNKRHKVKPGITGWAQVNGRNAITWDKKFELDAWYVDHQNLCLDLKILWLTIIKIFKREGIAHEGSVSMPRFIGNSVTKML